MTASSTSAALAMLSAAVLLTACMSTRAGQAPAAPTTRAPSTATRTTGPHPTQDAALIAAAYNNHLDTARALIAAGADVNTPDDTQQSAYLIATSEVGDDPRLLELTLAAGADVNAKDSYYGTGLIRAAERGYPRIVARLLDTDIQVDHVNRLGWTALLEAVILGQGGDEHARTVHALIGAGADVNLTDRDGTTALGHAQRRGHEDVARFLRAAGARSRA